MANTKCGSCGWHQFEVKDASPTGARYRQTYIQCSSCGVPIGVVGALDSGVISDENRTSLRDLDSQVGQLKSSLQQIDYRLARIEQLLN